MRNLIIFVLALLTLVGCSNSDDKQNVELEKSISTIVEDSNNKEILLSTLTDFQWEKAFLFNSYTTQEYMDEQLGIHFKDPSSINTRDDIYLLVFMNDNKVVQYAELKVQPRYFSINENKYLTPANDLITILGKRTTKKN